MPRHPRERSIGNGSPRIRGGATIDTASRRRSLGLQLSQLRCSSRRSLCLTGVIADHRDEEVGNVWRTQLAQLRELLAVAAFEKKYAATQRLPFRDGLQ